MKRFRFTLEALLTIRKRQEEEVRREFARKNDEITRAETELRQLHESLRDLATEEKERRIGSVSVSELRSGVGYRHTLKLNVETTGKQIQRLRKEAGQIRLRLVEATKKKRAVEILKERRYTQWKEAYRAQEQEFTDDLSQKKYAGNLSAFPQDDQ